MTPHCAGMYQHCGIFGSRDEYQNAPSLYSQNLARGKRKRFLTFGYILKDSSAVICGVFDRFIRKA